MSEGKRYIFICTGKDCKKAGAERIKKHLKSLRKENAALNNIEVIKTHCIDFCKKGPNLIIKDKVFNGVSEESLSEIILGK